MGDGPIGMKAPIVPSSGPIRRFFMTDNLLVIKSGASVFVEGSGFESGYGDLPTAQACRKVLISLVVLFQPTHTAHLPLPSPGVSSTGDTLPGNRTAVSPRLGLTALRYPLEWKSSWRGSRLHVTVHERNTGRANR